MKKAFAWSWVINGLIIGIIIISILYSVLSKMFIENARGDARDAMDDIYVAANGMCIAKDGSVKTLKLSMPNIVEGIYTAKEKDFVPEDIESKVSSGETQSGVYLCMKSKEEEVPRCKILKCEVEMTYIGTETTVISMAQKIMKRPTYSEYNLVFFRDENGAGVEPAD